MKKLLCILCLTWSALSSFAQSHVIKGKVIDETGVPLPGVTVTLKQTQRRTASDKDGIYAIDLGTLNNNVLVFSFVGYQTQEVSITGKTVIDIKLLPDSKDLSEVVISALNIPRAKKSLGVAQQSVNVNEMTEARAGNIADLLDGKVSGLQISTSGQPTGSTRVQIRGANSITGNNQPLWVVDGVPIDNNDSNGQVGNLDYGNNAADLNPDDIESIEVLKGPNAAALYGSKAANGAILVTTKKGKKNAGMGISVNSNYMASRVLQFPEFQNVYGEGGNGRLSGTLVGPLGSGVIQAGTGGGRNWGVPMLGQPYLTFDGKQTTYSPNPETVTGLYKVGVASSQNVAFSNATDNSAIRFSYTRYDANDVVQKQNQVAKNNFQLSTSKDFTPFIKIETRLQYIQERVTNRTYRNEDPANPLNYLINAVTSIPLSSLIPWKDANGNAFNGGGNGGIENPYWDINENGNQDVHNTIIGGVTATVKIFKDLQFRAQQSGNLLWGNRYTFIQKGSLSNINGSYNEFQQNNRVWNTEGLLMYNKRISDFSIVANVGGNLRKTDYYNTSAGTSSLAVHDVRSLANTTSIITANESFLRSQVNSVYGTANLGYKDFLYLDLTGRNDWSSTLPPANASFFYPSASASFVFTELWKGISPNFLNFGKIRASIARVGNDTSPYNLYNAFVNSGNFNGINYMTFESQLKNKNLKPELTTSTELGLELHFMNNRLSIDADVYKSKTINQLLTGNTPPEFGFTTQILNAGEIQNKGVEVTLTGTPIRTKNFSWDATYNFSLNRNLVKSLTPGIPSVYLGGAVTAGVYAEVGKPIGVIRAQDQAYSSDGYAIINQTTGIPYFTSINPIVGYASPRALMSFGSNFRYKNFSFNFLVSSRIGGSLFSGTGYRYFISGVATQTLGGRDAWLFSDGVLGENANEQTGITSIYNLPYLAAGRVKGSIYPGYYPVLGSNGQPIVDANGNYVANLSAPNTKYISPQTYWQQTNHISHLYTYDASYVKLSQVIVGYSLPARLLRGTPFRLATLSLVGRNLWTIFQKTPRGIDPESAAYSGNAQGLEVGGSLPYATYGADLKFSL
ncbi:SusC/RagA family TonB-linked outer membrane protein [Mucilaginibacter sp. SG564]|uniref:SusC/RagA family TonB-linked outer membrane protein n=1 Tax=Mucilaginibacter sp. SG564 TaxID=2587022 RepID=UPI001552441A|nr:SusC/RagA family TonB-linked outer membrane protein [Mucilaginibacter sp. SG564]NOW93636.1 TonB-linked SusC/RagA family outer membrane protein [Mucilaginibacter sp. SG564]